MKRISMAALVAGVFAAPVRGICSVEDETQAGSAAGDKAADSALAAGAKAAQKAAKKAKKPKAEKKAKAKKKSAHKGNPALKGPAILKTYAPKYRKGAKGEKTAGGNTPIDNDDKVARAFRGKDLEGVYSVVAKAIEVPMTELKKKYGKLNVGMQRMNLGNRYRGVLNAK